MPKKNECLLAKIGVITAETGPDRVEIFPKIEKSRRFMATTDRHLFSGFAFRQALQAGVLLRVVLLGGLQRAVHQALYLVATGR